MKKILVLILLMTSSLYLLAQDKEYCVVTFSEKISPIGRKTNYHFVIPIDEINSKNPVTIYDFIIGDYTILNEYGENYPPDYFFFPKSEQHPCVQCILQNKKLVQTFTVKYDDRKYKIKVKVYLTPIKGNLELLTSRYGANSTDYCVYISNDFQFCDNLYHNEKLLNFLRHQPFETVSYHHNEYEINLK